jgi:cellobiose-specific phosphotransferase system component IIC
MIFSCRGIWEFHSRTREDVDHHCQKTDNAQSQIEKALRSACVYMYGSNKTGALIVCAIWASKEKHDKVVIIDRMISMKKFLLEGLLDIVQVF